MLSSEFLWPSLRTIDTTRRETPLSTELTFLQNWKPMPNPSHAVLPPPSHPLHHCYLEEGTQANSLLWDPSLCGDTAERANMTKCIFHHDTHMSTQRCNNAVICCHIVATITINFQDKYTLYVWWRRLRSSGRRRCNTMQQANQQNMLVNLEFKMRNALAVLFRHFTHTVFLCSSCNRIGIDWDSCFPPQHETGSCMLKSQLKLPQICGAIMQNGMEAVRFCFFTSKAEWVQACRWKKRYKKRHSESFWVLLISCSTRPSHLNSKDLTILP